RGGVRPARGDAKEWVVLTRPVQPYSKPAVADRAPLDAAPGSAAGSRGGWTPTGSMAARCVAGHPDERLPPRAGAAARGVRGACSGRSVTAVTASPGCRTERWDERGGAVNLSA